MVTRELQAQYSIYRITCPHGDGLSVLSDRWCDVCDDWIDGTEVGDVSIYWEPNGDITVIGDGYADRHDEAYFHAMELQEVLP